MWRRRRGGGSGGWWHEGGLIRRLGTGEAVVINPTAKHPAEIVQVWQPGAGAHQEGG